MSLDLTEFKKEKKVGSGKTKTLLNFTKKTYPEAYSILLKLRAEGYDIKAIIIKLLNDAIDLTEDKTDKVEDKTTEEKTEKVNE